MLRVAATAAVAVLAGAQQCVFTFDAEGMEYDLSSLAAASPFTFQASGAQTYMFSFCGNITGFSCPPDGSGSVSLQLTPVGSGCLISYGQLSSPLANIYNSGTSSGLLLTYSGGAPCDSSGTLPSTSHVLICGSGTPRIIDQTIVQPGCQLTYTISTPAACGYKKVRTLSPLGAGWIAFAVLVSVVLLYCVGGSAYKRYKFGASGLEAIPNIDTWRTVWGFCAGICSCCPQRAAHTTLDDDEGAYYVQQSAPA